MKEMNQEAKDGFNDIAQKMLKESQIKRKQAEELNALAKVLEDTAQKLIKEVEGVKVTDETQNA